MASEYLLAKLLHILIAVVALGTSAGLGVLLEFYGDHATHGSFVLRAIERITMLVVLPGYALMLVTGIWLVDLSWSITARWILFALALWAWLWFRHWYSCASSGGCSTPLVLLLPRIDESQCLVGLLAALSASSSCS